MTDQTENYRSLLEKYAETLMAKANAGTEEDHDKIADNLIEINGDLEEHGEQVARLIYKLLGR